MKVQMDQDAALAISVMCRQQIARYRDEGIEIESCAAGSHIGRILELYNRAENIRLGSHADYDVMRVAYWMKPHHAKTNA